MTRDGRESPSGEAGARLADRHEDLVWWATWLGLLVAAIGLVDGLMMALKTKEAGCPDGKIFPEGTTDFSCYVHPQAGIGIAIAAISVLLGILIVLASIAARAGMKAHLLLSDRHSTDQTP